MFYSDIFDKEVEDKLKEYKNKFLEEFPLMEFEGNKKQLIKTINKCIKKNKKFFVEFEENEED